MLTIFDLLQWIAAAFGAILAYRFGSEYYGVVGGSIGGLAGGVIGYGIGKLPWLIAWRLFNIEGKSDDKLRAILDGDQYFLYHLALATLMKRGQNIDQYRPKLLSLLSSDEYDRRYHAWHSLSFAFPDLAKRCPDYNPDDPIAVCREKSQTIGGQPET